MPPPGSVFDDPGGAIDERGLRRCRSGCRSSEESSGGPRRRARRPHLPRTALPDWCGSCSEMCVSVLLTITTAAPSAVSSIIAISAMMSAVPSLVLEAAHRSGSLSSPCQVQIARSDFERQPVVGHVALAACGRSQDPGTGGSVPRRAGFRPARASSREPSGSRSRSASNWLPPPPHIGPSVSIPPGKRCQRPLVGRQHRKVDVIAGRVVEAIRNACRRLRQLRRIQSPK